MPAEAYSSCLFFLVSPRPKEEFSLFLASMLVIYVHYFSPGLAQADTAESDQDFSNPGLPKEPEEIPRNGVVIAICHGTVNPLQPVSMKWPF